MQIASSLLITAGIVFMIFSIQLTRKLLGIQEGKMFKSWRILLYFIAAFTLAYIAALTLVIIDLKDIIYILTGMVFLGGALFVYLVIRASLTSSLKLIETASAKNYLNDIFQTMGNILIVLDENNKIKTVNPTTCQKLGCSNETIIGQDVSKIIGNTKLVAGSLIETSFKTKSGKELPVLLSVNKLKDFNKNISVLVAQDITKQKESEKKLVEYTQQIEKTNKELDQFAYIVSHDLKAPLRAINNLSEWIVEDLGEVPEEIGNHLSLMRGRVHRMENLINGILDYSRIGRQNLQKEEINVTNLVEDIVDSINISENFKINIDHKMPILNSELMPLQQVFSNLISNAIKYHDKEKGNISIYHTVPNGKYEFIVKDDGPGIPVEYQERIFGIFQTIEARDTRESTGIGLSIIKKIIEEKGGKVWINSEEGKGAEFHFTWPKK
ncbi:MAG: PAS domain S-box protein [Bacteroidetes bacterium]|nr:PAS domain S-box protein [Bacteroidota bacterium]MBT7994051.1 PAS domain S-box protein [Bacteroidota bacterium]